MAIKLKYLLPLFVRKSLKKIYQKLFWSYYFKEYLKSVEKGIIPNKKLLQKLIETWGNQSFSAKVDFCETIIEFASKTDKLILECGSGLSTLLLGAIAKKNNIKIVSLEHMDNWAEKVEKELSKYHLNNNQVLVCPLVDYGDFVWYKYNELSDQEIGLCICDGPPGSNLEAGRDSYINLKIN